MRIFVLTATYELRVSRKSTYVTTLGQGDHQVRREPDWSPATQFLGRASRGRRQLPTAGACLHHTRTTPSPSRGARRRGWCSSSCWTRRCCSGIQERVRTDANSRISGSEQGSKSWAVRGLTEGGAGPQRSKKLPGRDIGILKTDLNISIFSKTWHAFYDVPY